MIPWFVDTATPILAPILPLWVLNIGIGIFLKFLSYFMNIHYLACCQKNTQPKNLMIKQKHPILTIPPTEHHNRALKSPETLMLVCLQKERK